ncbi:MAG: hypothetical protein IKS41_03405 [Alphaproteobacteria bacterium]|nr:hypothetical protein [Alphaproteobacteria bacterium]
MKFYSIVALALGIASITNTKVMAESDTPVALPGMGVAGILSFLGKTGHDMAMTRYYANEVLNTAAILSISATSANGGEGKDITLTELKKEFNPSFDLCNVDMVGYKNGFVKIMFGDDCQTPRGEDISLQAVQEQVQKLSGERANCSNRECLINLSPSRHPAPPPKPTSFRPTTRDAETREILEAASRVAIAAQQARSQESTRAGERILAHTYSEKLLSEGERLANVSKSRQQDLSYAQAGFTKPASVGFVTSDDPEWLPCQADLYSTKKGLVTLTLGDTCPPEHEKGIDVPASAVIQNIENLRGYWIHSGYWTYCEGNICQIDYSKRK